MRSIIIILLGISICGSEATEKIMNERSKSIDAINAKTEKSLLDLCKKAKDDEKPEIYRLILEVNPASETAKKFAGASGAGGDKGASLPDSLMAISYPLSEEIVKMYEKPELVEDEKWAKLPGAPFVIDATTVVNTGIRVSRQMQIMIVPNPSDRWSETQSAKAFGWYGREDGYMAIAYYIGDEKIEDMTKCVKDKLTTMSVIKPPANGILWIGPERKALMGKIRVKLLIVK